MDEQTKPDWIASTLSGQLKSTSALVPLNLKADDFDLKPSEDYWATPKVQEYFKGDRIAFNDFYNRESARYNSTKSDDKTMDNFVATMYPTKLSKDMGRPGIIHSYNTPQADLWGRSEIGDIQGQKQWSLKGKANENGVRVAKDKYIPLSDFKGATRFAKNADGSWKLNEKGQTYHEPISNGENMRSFDESYSPVADWAGIYGLDRSAIKQVPYFIFKNSLNFLSSSADGLSEFARMPLDVINPNSPAAKGVQQFQSDARRWKQPVTEEAEGDFWHPENLMDLGAQAALQLGGMFGIGKLAASLGASSKGASLSGRLFMTGITAGPLAQVARDNGLSEYETALLVGATLAPLYKISALSDEILSKVKPLELQQKMGKMITDQYGMSVGKYKFNPASLRSYMNGITAALGEVSAQTSGRPLIQTALLESIEEMGEQGIDVGARALFNQVAPMYGSDNKFNIDWGNEFQLMLQSGVGGAIGGSTVYPLLRKFGAAHPSVVNSFEDAVTLGEEGHLYKSFDQLKTQNRLGDTDDENRNNAAFLKETVNTMVLIRDRAGLKDVIKNNEFAAAKFNEVLKATEIGRDSKIMANRLYSLENELADAEKRKADPETIKLIQNKILSTKQEIDLLNSGKRVNRYVTEGLYNLTDDFYKGPDFKGRDLVKMNLETESFKQNIASSKEAQLARITDADETATPENYKIKGVSEVGKQRLLAELTQRRNDLRAIVEPHTAELQAIMPDYNIDELFSADWDSTSELTDITHNETIVPPSADNEFNPNRLIPGTPAFEAMSQLQSVTKQINEVLGYKSSEVDVEENPLLYHYEDGHSTIPFEQVAKDEEKLRSESKEGLYISDVPAEALKAIDKRLSQIASSMRFQDTPEFIKVPIGDDVAKVMTQLMKMRNQFQVLKDTVEQNMLNTDANLQRVYTDSLKEQIEMIEDVSTELAKTPYSKVVAPIIRSHPAMAQALASNNTAEFEKLLVQMEDDFYKEGSHIKTAILAEMTKSSGRDWTFGEEGRKAKQRYDYVRGVLSVKSSTLYSALQNTINIAAPDGIMPTDEQKNVALQAVRSALAGEYAWKPLNYSGVTNLHYSAAIDGGPGTGKTSSVVPLIAGIISEITNGKVILTAFKDEQNAKRLKINQDTSSFYGKSPEFVKQITAELKEIVSNAALNDDVSAIIYDEATLIPKTELDEIQQLLNKVNTARVAAGKTSMLSIIYTFDRYQNSAKDKSSNKSYSITSESVNIPTSPRLSFSFRSLNNPLKIVESDLRESQDIEAKRSMNHVYEYEGFKGVRVVKNRADFDKEIRKLVDHLKQTKELDKLAYITTDENTKGSDVASTENIKKISSTLAQGREWEYVIVDDADGKVFDSKEKISEYYTAATRAKQFVLMYASPESTVSSIEGKVKQFRQISPAIVRREEMLSKITKILSGSIVTSQKINNAPVVQPTTMSSVIPPAEEIEEAKLEPEEDKKFRDLVTKSVPKKAWLSTFFTGDGQMGLKRKMIYDKDVINRTQYFLTIAKIGSEAYTNIINNDKSFDDKQPYAMFLEGEYEGDRAIIGVLKESDALIKESGLMTNRETFSVPVHSDVIRVREDAYPTVENSSKRNGRDIDMRTKHSYLDIKNNTQGVNVSDILISTEKGNEEGGIKGRDGGVKVRPGGMFVVLSARHSSSELNDFLKDSQNVESGDLGTLVLDKEVTIPIERVIEWMKPYIVKKTMFSTFNYNDDTFKAIKDSFWANANNPDDKYNSKFYKDIYKDVMDKFKDDVAVQSFLKAKGQGFNFYFLLDNYILSKTGDNKTSATPIYEKLMNAVLEHPAMRGGLRFSPPIAWKSTKSNTYSFIRNVPENILNEIVHANYWHISMPKLKIDRDLLLKQATIQSSAPQGAPELSGSDIEGNVIQGTNDGITPISLSEFKKREFPTNGALAREAIRRFKSDVINNQFILEGDTASYRNVNDAMVDLRARYLSDINRNSEAINDESNIRMALGRHFDRLLKKHFPAIHYNVKEGVYELSTGFKKSDAFSENDDMYVLDDGMSDIVKTYLYNTPLYEQTQDGRWHKTNKFIGPRDIIALTRATYPRSFKSIDSLPELQSFLEEVKTPEAYSMLVQFFRAEPIVYQTRDGRTAKRHSVFNINNDAAQGIVNSIFSFLKSVEEYNPGFTEVNGYSFFSDSFEKISKFERSPKIPFSSIRPSIFKDNFSRGLTTIIKTRNVSSDKDAVTMNGQVIRVKSDYSDKDVVGVMQLMGLYNYKLKNLTSLIQRNPEGKSLPDKFYKNIIMDYFFQTAKTLSAKEGKLSQAAITPNINLVLESYVSDVGLGDNFSVVDSRGKRQYTLRNTCPEMRLTDEVNHLRRTLESMGEAAKFNPLTGNLLLNPNSNYSISPKATPFLNQGMKYKINGRERNRPLSDMTQSELLQTYIVDGFINPIDKKEEIVYFPITVYSDSSTELSVPMHSKAWFRKPEEILSDLFQSRFHYYTNIEQNILRAYASSGINAANIEELAKIVNSGKVQTAAIKNNPLMTVNLHYVDNKGIASIKPKLIADIIEYTRNSEKSLDNFIIKHKSGAADFVNRLKTDETLTDINNTSLFKKIEQAHNELSKTKQHTTAEYIENYYYNQMLVASEFQKLTNGPEYQYKGDETQQFIDMVKRSKSKSSPAALFVYRDKSWSSRVSEFQAANPGQELPFNLMYEGMKLNRYARVAVITDPVGLVEEYDDGSKSLQKIFDGATFVTPLTRIMQTYSSGGGYGRMIGPVMKNITHAFDPLTATKTFIKNAEFEITPEILRNGNDTVLHIFKNMFNQVYSAPVMVGGQATSTPLETLTELGVNIETFENIERGHFTQLAQILVRNGQQDVPLQEAIPLSSYKTGAHGVNEFNAQSYTPITLDMKYKGTQQDAMKDPTKGLDTKVLTQLVNTLAINWKDDPTARGFYETLGEITKTYLDEFKAMSPESRMSLFQSLMKDDILKQDDINYRTDAATNGNLSINDRQISGLYSQKIASLIKDNAITYALRGGHYVVHPSVIPLYDVIDYKNNRKLSVTRSQLKNYGQAPAKGFTRLFIGQGVQFFSADPVHAAKTSVGNTLSAYIDVESAILPSFAISEGIYQLPQEIAVKAVASDVFISGARDLKWIQPVRLSDGKSLSEVYATEGIEATHASLEGGEWSVGEAEVLLPAEMMHEFMLEDAITTGIPIEEINAEYFYEQLTKSAKDKIVRVEAIIRRAEEVYKSFQLRTKGVVARIPTSGKHSAVSTRIAGFVNESMNSIYAPHAMLKIQGADQDIDKGSYLTFKSLVQYVMKNPNSRDGRTYKTFNPKDHKFDGFVVVGEKPTGIIPLEQSMEKFNDMFSGLNKEDLKAIQRMQLENKLVRSIKQILNDPRNIVEGNLSVDKALEPMRKVRDEITKGDKTPFSQDDLMSYLKVHEMNQAGGKNITGIFANGSKAYNVLYTLYKYTNDVNGKTLLAGLEGNNEVWRNYAGLIGATVDNANEGVLGPLQFDNITAPFVSYLTSVGMTNTDIYEYIQKNKAFFTRLTKLQHGDSPRRFNPEKDDFSKNNPLLKALFYRTEEYNLLSRAIVNRDIPVRPEDIASYIISFERFVNMSIGREVKGIKFSLVDYVNNDEYAAEMISRYQNLIKTDETGVSPASNHNHNILRIFKEVPHIKQYLRGLIVAHEEMLNEKAYNLVFQLERENKEMSSDNSHYFYSTNDYRGSYEFVHGAFIDSYLKSRNFNNVTPHELGTPQGRQDFISDMNNSLDKLQARYAKADNEFVSNLRLIEEKDNGVSWNRLRLPDFYEMNEEMKSVLMDEFAKMSPVDKQSLFLYNLITTRDKNSKGSLSSMFSFDDKSDFVNYLDYEVNPNIEQLRKVIDILAEADRKSIEKGENIIRPDHIIPFEVGFTEIVEKGYHRYPFRDATVVLVKNVNSRLPYVVTSRSGVQGRSRYILLNEVALGRDFNNKIWEKPVKQEDGTRATPLPQQMFKNLEQYRKFTLEREFEKLENPKADNMSFGQYEDKVTEAALSKIGNQVPVRYKSYKKVNADAQECGISTT